VPIKPQYGPTLGQLLSPRWRAASTQVRVGVIAAAVGLTALALIAVLTFENAKYSHGGPVPFSFSYRGLYRVAHDPGGYVKVQRHSPAGRLEDSFAVEPLRLPPYTGSLSAELPLYASRLTEAMSRSDRGFTLRGEGKTRVNSVPAYNIFYTTVLDGQSMYGRDVLLLPERLRAREGVEIVMLTAPASGPRITSPSEVAGSSVPTAEIVHDRLGERPARSTRARPLSCRPAGWTLPPRPAPRPARSE
jgi:hypothetical protein